MRNVSERSCSEYRIAHIISNNFLFYVEEIQRDATVYRYLFTVKSNEMQQYTDIYLLLNPTRCNSIQIFIYCQIQRDATVYRYLFTVKSNEMQQYTDIIYC